MSEFKTCSKCGVVKAVAEFRAKRNACKTCENAISAAYRKANPEKMADLHAAWINKNPGRGAVMAAAYRKANPEKVAKQQNNYRKSNPERWAARFADWYKENPKKVAEKNYLSVSEIRPAYAARLLSIPVSLLSPELLTLKREQLSTRRLSRQINQAIKAQGASA